MTAPAGLKEFRERIVIDVLVHSARELTDHERETIAKRVSDAAHIQGLAGMEGFEPDYQADYKVMHVHQHHSARRRTCPECVQMAEDEMPSPAAQ